MTRFDDLDQDVQAKVVQATRAMFAARGDFVSASGSTQHAATARLAVELHDVLTPITHGLATSDQVRAHRDRIAATLQLLDEVSTAARQSLDTAAEVLVDLEELVVADEQRRAAAAEHAARRQVLDREVARLAAAEDAQADRERRRRLEEQARERLGVAG